jgi:uncharacterized iron-regulated membrane protein
MLGMRATTNLHGTLWRWHFLAGLAACPIVLVVALTGALYSFQPELEAWKDAALLRVEPGPARLPLDRLIASVPGGPDGCTPIGIDVSPRPDRSVRVWCSEGARREVLVDPYRGQVLGQREWEESLFGLVFRLHWDLLLGERGRLAVEWATSWVVLLLLSGAALWWPRGKRRGGGVFWPRGGLRGRQRLRDLHAVFGAYAVPVLFALAATGLFWTALAGQERWHRLVDDRAQRAWEAPPTSTVRAGGHRIGLDAAVRAAGLDLARDERALYLSPPAAPQAPYALFVYDPTYESPSRSEAIWVDAYSGALLDKVGWGDRSAIGKIDGAGYAVHVGAFLALPGRILACAAALVLAALSATGPWMWWKRRPRGGLALPPRARRVPWPMLAALAGLGWLLPAVGWTFIAVLAIEGLAWLWRRAFADAAGRIG